MYTVSETNRRLIDEGDRCYSRSPRDLSRSASYGQRSTGSSPVRSCRASPPGSQRKRQTQKQKQKQVLDGVVPWYQHLSVLDSWWFVFFRQKLGESAAPLRPAQPGKHQPISSSASCELASIKFLLLPQRYSACVCCRKRCIHG